MPLAAPVMMATLFLSFMSGFLRSVRDRFVIVPGA
jgi:hypothetical protein